MSVGARAFGARLAGIALIAGALALTSSAGAVAGPINPPHPSPLPGAATPESSAITVTDDAISVTARLTGLAPASKATVSAYFVPDPDVTSQGSGPGVAPLQRITADASADGTATLDLTRHSLGALGPGTVTVAYVGTAPDGIAATGAETVVLAAGAETFDAVEAAPGGGGSLVKALAPPLILGLLLVVGGVTLLGAGIKRRRRRTRRPQPVWPA